MGGSLIDLKLAEEFILAFFKHPFLRLEPYGLGKVVEINPLTLSNHKIDGPKIKECGQVDPIRV